MPIFKLKFGESVQFKINGRHVYLIGIHYTRDILNVAYGEYNPSIFTQIAFKRIVDMEAELF